MEETNWRIRISILWLIDAISVSATFILSMLEPGTIDGILAGQLEGMDIDAGVLGLASVFWLAPLLMAYLTMAVRQNWARLFNIVLGLLLGIANTVDFISGISSGDMISYPRSLMVALMAVVPLLVAWHAWGWPRKVKK